ncbi:hypothetical protein M3638_03060 [Oceanobacillus profundus]|uniref:hypothetical protein n=1 Tax=Oceanobacillus profundus TaxID=372463 RepID=UPI0020403992|nr:hypothetical protein [Oceanobacillus profundus]MCM3396819.1 hypothetical protein [Oceanobacillus profundus]
MSEIYYFNDNKDKHGRHEVHRKSCSYLPAVSNRTMIGSVDDCKEAIRKAKSEHPYKEFDGCYHCSYLCHNG